ncbi:hypothetical protein SLS59_006998 [Nothophoma quercina]|uniref:Protein kinase domain-containing protein n=1 Tax=Nothophoma quercina TaxID=749835 RepID=A0ABR3R1L6_9PLEO
MDEDETVKDRPVRPKIDYDKELGSTTDLNELHRQIHTIRVENCNSQPFVLESKLPEVITKEVIEKLMRKFNPSYKRQEISTWVTTRGTKVFAVLVMISRSNRIQDFIFNDQYHGYKVDHQRLFSKDELVKIFDDDLIAAQYFDKQWEFWAPTFSGEVTHRVMLDRIVFPFMSRKPLAKGGFGDVSRIRIHPYYHPPSFKHVEEFVKKELSLSDDTFETEAHTLAILQQLRHPNILPLVSCYTWQQKHNLISPYMRGGNLRQLLQEDRKTDCTREDLFVALAGVTSALWALHECVLDESEPILKGLHQDLNPDNILVDNNRFILADFGLSSIKNLSADSKTQFKGGGGYYKAPECADLALPYGVHDATRATDVWATACMIADLLVHFVRGGPGVEEFRKAREFGIHPIRYRGLFHKGEEVNHAVKDWLDKIAGEDGSKSMREVVLLVLSMLKIAPDARPKSSDVTVALYQITIEAFCDHLCALFVDLEPSWEVLIEKSRMRAWLKSQTTDFFLNMPGPTKAHQVFESTVDLLHRFADQLEILNHTKEILDSRALWQVRGLNTQLSSMLPRDKRSSSQFQFDTILLAEARAAGFDVNSPKLVPGLGFSRINQKAQYRWLVAQTTSGTASPGPHTFQELKPSQFSKETERPVSIAKVRTSRGGASKTLLLETVQYQDRSTGKRLKDRFLALCTLLSNPGFTDQHRTPKLSALCNNVNDLCYDLLYEIPTTNEAASTPVDPVTLHALLKEDDQVNYPSLDRRLGLALQLAEALADIHDLEWFHKDLTSSNIVFFPPVGALKASRSSNPYLYGFGHSRKASDEFTQGPLQNSKHHRYHYPGYVSVTDRMFKTFIRQYDWYSLGVVLLEIGFWRPIDIMMADDAKRGNEAFAKHLRDIELPALSFYLGRDFVDIIRFCLDSPQQDFADSDPDSQPNAVFRKMVVSPLQTLAGRLSGRHSSRKRKADDDIGATQPKAARRRH